jgi:hypothetical protein
VGRGSGPGGCRETRRGVGGTRPQTHPHVALRLRHRARVTWRVETRAIVCVHARGARRNPRHVGEFADSHRHTVSLKNASRFFGEAVTGCPYEFFTLVPVYKTRHSSHDSLFDFFGVSFGVSQS